MSQYPQPGQPPQYGAPQAGYAQPGYGPATVSKPTGWFVVNWLFFWPLAIYSLVAHWNKIDPAAYAGDIAGAQAHAKSVKTLGIVALVVAVVIYGIVIITSIAAVSSIPTY